MKKLLSIVFLITVILLTSCQARFDPKEALAMPLKITAHLEGSNALFTTEIYEGSCDIFFDESHSLFGTELHLRDDGNTAKAGDFSREVKKGTFPAQEALTKAIKKLNESDIAGVKAENGTKYTIDEMTIIVYYNEDTKQITSIETEENERRFNFIIVGREPYEVQSNGAGQP